MTDSKITSPHPPKLFAERNRICMTQNHPGPVLPVLEVGKSHTPEHSLAAQYYLGISNEKFQWVQQYGGDRFASKEKRLHKFRSFLGNNGNGWLRTKKHVFKNKKIAKPKKTANSDVPSEKDPPIIKVTSTRVEGGDIKDWMQHYVNNLIDTNQFVDLTEMEHCPPHLWPGTNLSGNCALRSGQLVE